MRGVLPQLARDLGADERTLRRAVAGGAVRCSRPSSRRIEISAAERRYLRDHWGLLAALRRTLRTEPNVALAVLYGSVARGEEDEGSDLDVLVALKRDSAQAAASLRRRLATASGRTVGLARLAQVERSSPLLLAEILAEGRVLVDRAEQWPRLQTRRGRIERRARAAYSQEMAGSRAALDRLLRRTG